MTDLLIIGGGAAGLMAAGAACARGLTTAVVEHNPKGPGQKLLITGKGRCNVTNDCDVREFLNYVRHNPRFLYSALYAFSPASAMELFESLGVPLKTERGCRVFPQSDRAADVLAACREKGLLVLTAKTRLRLLPPLTLTAHDVDMALEVLAEVLGAMEPTAPKEQA